jgi:hypothetical protein
MADEDDAPTVRDQIAVLLQRRGLTGGKTSFLGTFMLLAEFVDEDGSSWITHMSGTGSGVESCAWARIGMLETQLESERHYWRRNLERAD